MSKGNIEAEEADGRWLLNEYYCPTCDICWSDEWSCACDDDCPECGGHFTPCQTTTIRTHGGAAGGGMVS